MVPTDKTSNRQSSRRKTYQCPIPGIDQNDILVISNCINQHFASVADDLPLIDTTQLPAYRPSLFPPPNVQYWDVYRELKQIKCGKSGGPDKIPARLIREFAYELTTPLTHIFNTSLELGIVPDVWKRAVIVPIPKSSPAVIDKLRPIALTDHFAKIIEGFVARWTVEDLKSSMDRKQFGNRKGLSTTHCLIDLLHTLYGHAETRKTTSTLVLTDFSKAFDRIDHNIAIKKLISLDVDPSLVHWIANFLTDRKQCVRYKAITSDWTAMHAGVSQGTRLGPIVFSAVINDACQNFSDQMHCWKYVNDLSLVETRLANEQSGLQETIDALVQWSENSNVRLNPTKCTTMEINFMKEPPVPSVFYIKDNALEQSETVKLLGVQIQQDLKWDTHINTILQRANGRFHMLRVLKSHGLPVEDLITIYIGFLRPLLEYAVPVWNGAITNQQKDQLEKYKSVSLD